MNFEEKNIADDKNMHNYSSCKGLRKDDNDCTWLRFCGELFMRYMSVSDKKGAEDTSYLAKYKKISCSAIHLSTI